MKRTLQQDKTGLELSLRLIRFTLRQLKRPMCSQKGLREVPSLRRKRGERSIYLKKTLPCLNKRVCLRLGLMMMKSPWSKLTARAPRSLLAEAKAYPLSLPSLILRELMSKMNQLETLSLTQGRLGWLRSPLRTKKRRKRDLKSLLKWNKRS